MKFALRKILTNVFVVENIDNELDVEYDESGVAIDKNLPVDFAVLNPDPVTCPKVKGLRYLYTLAPMASNLIIPTNTIEDAIGVNSNQDIDRKEFEMSKTNCFSVLGSFFVRSGGAVDPNIRRRINSSGVRGLLSFINYCEAPGKSVEEHIKEGEATGILLRGVLTDV